MKVKYPEVGICGLSCRLCPRYHTDGESRCGGCKTESRMGAGCPFITCALKKRGLEFCWDCGDGASCEKWQKHRDAGRKADSFKCYQRLEDDIAFTQKNGVAKLVDVQKERERLLKEMLRDFNDGRSKSLYCIAATVLEVEELRGALSKARIDSNGLDAKAKAKVLQSALTAIAEEKGYRLKLRK